LPESKPSAPKTAAERAARSPRRGPGRPTREQTALRNQELLDQALDLFLEHGFDATTIEAISSAIGMSRRTIYTRYGDKTGLFKTAIQSAIDDWAIARERLQQAESDDLEETLLRIGRMWVANLQTPAGMRLVRIANTEVFRQPEIAAYLWERTAQSTVDYLTDLFRRRLRPGAAEVPDAVDAALAFLVLVVEGSIQLAVWGRIPAEDFDRQVAYRVRLFLDGVRAAPDSAPRIADK